MDSPATNKDTQPVWHIPTGTHSTGLHVNNSLCKGKPQEFIPAKGKSIKWYTCGPTVYDASHLGHARNYLTFDILRRIMEDYFGYNVFYVMNITDIDDKIILNARKNYFFKQYIESNQKLTEEIKNELLEAWNQHISTIKTKIAKNEASQAEQKGDLAEKQAALNLLLENLQKATDAVAALTAAEVGSVATSYIAKAQGPISDVLDARLHKTIDADLIKKLSLEHAQYYEKDFFQDMHALGIKDPDVITRVTEYVPAILNMVEKIIERGYAYPSQGSVYFDVAKFHLHQGHCYAKLSPEKVGDLESLAEGEGGLIATGEKKSDKDFALWKASKPGEPHWESANKFGGSGLGRPGWHIECSAMAGELFGSNMDIHSGGWDLKFPHHDNEMAQSEAFFDNQQWVNYFLHSGHLNIDGLKMSKSLKNFITIKEILAQYSAVQLRFYFLLQKWDQPMNYQRKNTMLEVNTKIKAFSEFFNKVKTLSLEHASTGMKLESWSVKEVKLNEELLVAQENVHKALSQNFDTKSAIQHLINLVTAANIYMTDNPEKRVLLLNALVSFIKKILNVFGVSSFDTEAGSTGASKEETVFPYVSELVNFRKEVRTAAKNKEQPGVFLSLCDQLRNERMPPLGVKIVDDADVSFAFVSAETLKEEARQQAEAAAAAEAKKRANKVAKLTKDIAMWEKSAITPSELIQQTYKVELKSKDDPLPEDMAKSTKKNIQKDWNNQEKAHAKYQAELAKNAHFLQEMKDELRNLQ